MNNILGTQDRTPREIAHLIVSIKKDEALEVAKEIENILETNRRQQIHGGQKPEIS